MYKIIKNNIRQNNKQIIVDDINDESLDLLNELHNFDESNILD